MFWKRKAKLPTEELTLRTAFEAISRYGEMMEQYGNAFVDASFLPLPKSKMKQALMMAWENVDDERLKSMIGVGYIGLANFQEGVGNSPIYGDISPNNDIDDNMNSVEEWLKWSRISCDEAGALNAEWSKFTESLRAGPRPNRI